MRIIKYSILFTLLVISFSLQAQMEAGPVKVEIREENGQWQLYRGGEPYYVKGVGGLEYMDQAKEYGANSVRSWSAGDAARILDEAQEKGMTVLFGLWVGQERQGFDYDDGKSVAAQLERFREVVKTYKDHPAVLMWGIGNECDLFYEDFKVWNAINDIAKMIHEEDPKQRSKNVTAGLDVAEVQLIKERAPHIDIYGINTYGGLIGIDKEIRAYGWEGPYMITEWGPNGHWEVPKTAWGAPIEQSSSVKADWYRKRYEEGIYADQAKCIGSYVFLWGQKQETTPTWYGVFLEDGTETEVIDVLEYSWSGKWPTNKSPHIDALKINKQEAMDNVYLKAGQVSEVMAAVTDPEEDQLKYVWEIVPESTDIKSGGDAESRPEALDMIFEAGAKEGGMSFRAPKKSGAYRLFTYVYDGNGNAAVANIPFYVR